MELTELEDIWRACDKKITDNVRLNKEILRKMLISGPEKRLNRIRIKSGFSLFSPIILLLLIWITNIQFHLTVHFYIGLGLFMPVYIISYVWEMKYFLLICKINLSDAILTVKKRIAQLEKYKIKITRIRYMLMPLAVTGIFLMLFQKPIFHKESLVMLVLIVLVFISSIYYTFRYSIHERFKALKKEIEEIEEMEEK